MTIFHYSIIHLILVLIASEGAKAVNKVEFPIEKFLGVHNSNFLRKYKRKLLCSPHMNQTSDCCQCEPTCVKYRTCCADYHWYIGNFTNIDLYKTYIVNISNTFKGHKCIEPFYHPSVNDFSVTRYYVIKDCPKGAKLEDIEGCLSSWKLESSIPVRGSDGYVYYNMYCAKCHGVENFEMLPLVMKCKTGLPIQFDCRVQINSTDDIAECIAPNFRTCLPGHKYSALCNSFKGVLHLVSWVNYFCILCSGNKIDFDTVRIDSCYHAPIVEHKQNWATDLHFIDTSEKHLCKAKTIFEVAKGACFPFFCPNGYQAAHSKCFKNPFTYIPKGLTVQSFDECFLTDKMKLYAFNTSHMIMKKIRQGLDRFGTESVNNINADKKIIKMLERTTTHLRNYVLSSKDEFIYLIDEKSKLILSHIDLSKISFYDNPAHLFPRNRICAKPKLLMSDLNITSNCLLIYNHELIDQSNLSILVEFNRNSINRLFYTCSLFHLPIQGQCSISPLTSGSTVVHEGGTLVHLLNNGTEIRYDVENYTPLRDGLYGVCSQALPNHNESFMFYNFLCILTMLVIHSQ